MSSTTPLHARPSHRFTTPRLILRSGIPSDAKAVCTVRSEPMNNPYGGVHEPDLTAEVQAERIEAQQVSTARGENGWVQIILKPELTDHVVDDLVVEDGILVGMTGFNSFPKEKVGDKEVIVGDMGAMIDYRYARKGFALEAMEAVFEYGFNELGCGMLSLDTHSTNQPWRKLMQTMGLENAEEIRKVESGHEEVGYKFDRSKWEDGKQELKESGKWYL